MVSRGPPPKPAQEKTKPLAPPSPSKQVGVSKGVSTGVKGLKGGAGGSGGGAAGSGGSGGNASGHKQISLGENGPTAGNSYGKAKSSYHSSQSFNFR